MNLFALSGILIGISSLTFGFFVYFKNRKSRINQVFLLFAISVATWGFGGCKIALSIDPSTALFWWRITHIGVIFIPIFFLHFTYLFLEVRRKKIIWLVYLIGLFFLFVDFTDLFIKDLRFVFSSFYYISNPGFLYSLFVFLWFSSIIYSHYELFKSLQKSSGLKRAQIKYFFLAMAVGFSGGGTCFLPVFNINLYPIFNFTVPLYPAIMAYAILKYRLMDIRVVIRASVVYVFSFLSVLGLAFGSYFLINTLFTPPILLEILIISALAAGLFHPLTNLYLKIANRYFFYSLYSYQETLKDLSGRLTAILDLDRLSNAIVKEIIDIMKLDKAGVLLRDIESGKYQIQYITGFKEENGISLVKDNFLTQQLEKTQRPVVYEELGLRVKDARDEEIKQKLIKLRENMKRIEAELCLPLMSKEQLKGIIVLGRKLSGESYSIQDLRLLETLANQASLAIENAQLYNQVQDLTKNLQQRVREQTKEIEQLSEIKSEFLRIVNHQLRTPTSIIKGMLSMLIEGSIEGKEKRKEALDKIYASADRLETILDDLLNAQDLVGAKPVPNLQPCDLERLIDEVIELLSTSAKQKKISLVFNKPTKSLPPILLDERLIEKTLKKLIDNAILYTEKGGITIKTNLIKQNQKEFIQIIIQDTGMGITEQDKSRLFHIFSRGKEAEQKHPNGSGLGLYIAKEYIEAHQGKIEAESQGKDKGSAFIVTLPIVTEV